MLKLDPSLIVLLNEMINCPTRDNVLPKYQMVLKVINSILGKIQDCEDENKANKYFDLLQDIHSPLAVLVFKEKLDEYSSINKFVSDFDRIDDSRLRKYMFNKIKNEKYTLSSE